jgi:hypothetical protein
MRKAQCGTEGKVALPHGVTTSGNRLHLGTVQAPDDSHCCHSSWSFTPCGYLFISAVTPKCVRLKLLIPTRIDLTLPPSPHLHLRDTASLFTHPENTKNLMRQAGVADGGWAVTVKTQRLYLGAPGSPAAGTLDSKSSQGPWAPTCQSFASSVNTEFYLTTIVQ